MMLLLENPSYKHEIELKTLVNRHQTLVVIHECQIMIDVKGSYAFLKCRPNATLGPNVGELGVGKMGVGEPQCSTCTHVPVPSINKLL